MFCFFYPLSLSQFTETQDFHRGFCILHILDWYMQPCATAHCINQNFIPVRNLVVETYMYIGIFCYLRVWKALPRVVLKFCNYISWALPVRLKRGLVMQHISVPTCRNKSTTKWRWKKFHVSVARFWLHSHWNVVMWCKAGCWSKSSQIHTYELIHKCSGITWNNV